MSEELPSAASREAAPAHRAAMLFAVIAGTAAALLFFGPRALNPRDISWLIGDPATHYLGWAFLRHEPHWHLIPTWTEQLGYPWGLSISLLDPNPLIALLLRPFSPLLGEPFQYLGLYAGLCFVLQAYLGFLLAARAGLGTTRERCLAAAFFLLAAPFLWRLHQHIALSSHWLLLAGLLAYLRRVPAEASVRWLAPLWAIVALAGAIHPYLAVMVLGVAGAGAVRLRLEGRIGSLAMLLAVLAAAGLFLASIMIFGFVSPGSAPGGGGYRGFSMNLLAPLDPLQYGGLLWGALPQASKLQYEGYNYLGLGVLGLLVLGLALRRWPMRALRSPLVLPLLGLALLLTLAAASATLTIGSYTILDLPLPERLETIAATFRSSGRLFWPVYYLLLFLAVAAATRLRSGWREAVLACALALQVADLAPVGSALAAWNRQTAEEVLHDPIWHRLGATHRHLVVAPPTQCGRGQLPVDAYRIFGLLAVEQRMTLNSYYSARVTGEERRNHCVTAMRAIESGQLEPETAYVLSDRVLRRVEAAGQSTHRCALVDGFNLCLDRRATGNMQGALP